MSDKYTLKSQEVLQETQSLALRRSHQQVDVAHLAMALLSVEGHIVPEILQKAGVPLSKARSHIESRLNRLPVVKGNTQLSATPLFRDAVVQAEKEAKDLRDDFVSPEHFLLALLGVDDDFAKTLGLTRDQALQSMSTLRGSHRVTDENPEAKYQALEKYGRDLTEAARQGKLDPVIGRDEERKIRVIN